jgi:hypothetical protein
MLRNAMPSVCRSRKPRGRRPMQLAEMPRALARCMSSRRPILWPALSPGRPALCFCILPRDINRLSLPFTSNAWICVFSPC